MTMKRAIRVSLWVGITTLSLGTWAVAQTSVTLTGPPPGNTYDGIYVSPYYATVGGATNTPVVCDDFGDNTSMGDHWTATVTPFSGTTAPTNTSWGLAGGTLTQYDVVAWFTIALINLPTSVQPANTLTLQVIDSFALWAVFDPSGVASYLKNNPLSTNAALCADIFGSFGCGWTAADGTPDGSAYAGVTGVPRGGYNLEILSPLLASGSVCKAGSDACPAQEFIAMVPEGGAALAYLLLAGLCCFGAMFMRSRRQNTAIAVG
jgi:hypothetical protein